MVDDTVEDALYRYAIGAWRQIKHAGLDAYVGRVVRGVEITPQYLLAAYHSKGMGGLRQFLESGAAGDAFDEWAAAPHSAAELAQQLAQSRRRSLENDIADIFTGGGNGRTPPFTTGNQNRFSGTLFNLVESMVGSALGKRTHSRSTTGESSRSIEARQNWNLSAGQQQALLAKQAQLGRKNL